MESLNWINKTSENTMASYGKVISLPSNNVISVNKKRPIFIQLQKTGNAFTIAKPYSTSSNSSDVSQCKIQKLNSSDGGILSSLSASFDQDVSITPEKQYNAILQGRATKPVRNLLMAAKQPTLSLPVREQYHRKIAIDPRSQYLHINPGSNNNTCSIENTAIGKGLAVNNASNAASSSQEKQTKRQYKKRQPAKSSNEPKYNFPPPPKKLDFKVSTTTQFETAIDNDQNEQRESEVVDNSSSMGLQDIVHGKSEIKKNSNDQIETAQTISDQLTLPSNVTKLKKLVINTSKKQNISSSHSAIKHLSPNAQELPISSEVPGNFGSSDGDRLFLSDKSETTAPAVDSNVSELTEVLKRLDRIEALQLAAVKRDSEMMVAIKKMYLANKQFIKQVDGDFDEIKSLLPISSLDELNEIDQRLRDDPDFAKIMKAYLRGFKDSNNSDDFTSIFRRLIKDCVIDEFNLKGVCGKHKLEDYKIVNIIQDIHLPMDSKTFDKLMRNTIEKAKNRYHNCNYRIRKTNNDQIN